MRVILITLFLLIVVTIAEEVDISKTIEDSAEVIDISKVNNPSKDAGIRRAINPTRVANIGVNLMFDYNQARVYKSPKFKRNVMNCSSHAVDACSSGTTLHHQDKGMINNQNGLAHCLFESMEKCLIEHGASLYETTSTYDQFYRFPRPRPQPPIPPGRFPVPPFPLPPPTPLPPPKPNTFPFVSKENQQVPSVSPLSKPMQIPWPDPIPYPPAHIPPVQFPPVPPVIPLPVPRPQIPKSNIFSSTSKHSHQLLQFDQIEPIRPIDPIQPELPPPVPILPPPSDLKTFSSTSKHKHEALQFEKIEPIRPIDPIQPQLPPPVPILPPPSDLKTFSSTSKHNHQALQFDQIQPIRPIDPIQPQLPPPVPILPPPSQSNTFYSTFKYNHHQGPQFEQRELPKLHDQTILPRPTPRQTLEATQYESVLVETLKFQTVLKTCTHVSAQTCYTDANVSKSVLASCLMPSMNQCMYPTATTSGNMPNRA